MAGNSKFSGSGRSGATARRVSVPQNLRTRVCRIRRGAKNLRKFGWHGGCLLRGIQEAPCQKTFGILIKKPESRP